MFCLSSTQLSAYVDKQDAHTMTSLAAACHLSQMVLMTDSHQHKSVLVTVLVAVSLCIGWLFVTSGALACVAYQAVIHMHL